MAPNEYEKLSSAGDSREQAGTKFFYLAPFPLPTGVTGFDSRKLCRETNETCMDFSAGQATFEFTIRAAVGSVMGIVLLFFICSLAMTYVETLHNNISYLIHLIAVFLNPYFWGFIVLIISVHSGLFYRACHHLMKNSPIRFNRQRREVAYVAKRGQSPRFVPWEEVIACVTSGKVVTQYGVHNSFSLIIGLRDAESGDVLWITVPTGSLMLAVSEWEAIRSYMEEGLDALPRPVSEEFEPGTVAFFHYCRQVYRDNHSYIRYLFGFILIQFCSGWTLPCHIAAWVERLPKTSFPKAVLEWSKPLPPEQWQKPSDELIEESKAVRKSLRAGRSVFDHFREVASVKEPLRAKH